MLTRLLSKHQRRIARLIARGYSNREIGQRLGIKEGTVKIHAHNIYNKTATRGRVRLATALQKESHRRALSRIHRGQSV